MVDYLIVGAGLYGAVFAQAATARGKRCLVVEKRPHIGGNLYTETVEGIEVHRYGAHIFHTSNQTVWDYMSLFTDWIPFINSPLARFGDELYNLPFNMNTFHQMWGVVTPEEAREKIDAQIAAAGITEPRNLEEQALSLVGRDIYEKLVKGYTEKQWGRPAVELPGFIIKRLPVRLTYNNNYFSDTFQGIPAKGYTAMIARMLSGSEVQTGVDFLKHREALTAQAKTVVYTGPVDAYFDECYGSLAYRSLRFETRVLDCPNWQGNAVVNYTSADIPWTRIIEHKHFAFGNQPKTVITREYPHSWKPGDEPYYPVNDDKNNALYARYAERAAAEPGVIFGGRLGSYRYYDMHQIVEEALADAAAVMGTPDEAAD